MTEAPAVPPLDEQTLMDRLRVARVDIPADASDDDLNWLFDHVLKDLCSEPEISVVISKRRIWDGVAKIVLRMWRDDPHPGFLHQPVRPPGMDPEANWAWKATSPLESCRPDDSVEVNIDATAPPGSLVGDLEANLVNDLLDSYVGILYRSAWKRDDGVHHLEMRLDLDGLLGDRDAHLSAGQTPMDLITRVVKTVARDTGFRIVHFDMSGPLMA
jgi:hypothetical protein